MSKHVAGTVLVLLLGIVGFVSADEKTQQGTKWKTTWATAVAAPSPFDFQAAPPPIFNDTTLRQIARVSVGGKKVRVWLTNEFGSEPLNVGAATVALRDTDSSVIAKSVRRLTFGGQPDITIAVGSRVVSDPVYLRVPDLADLAVSIHLPDDASVSTSALTFHPRALQTSYHAPGDQTAETEIANYDPSVSWYYLSAIDVLTDDHGIVLVALGDSITDGDQLAAMEPVDQNARYTNFLAQRLLRHGGHSVVNVGYSGNQLTADFIGENGQSRLARDVLTQRGATHVLVLLGINDIGLPGLLSVIGIPTPEITAETIISGLQQVVARSRARGLVVIGGTLTPSGSVLLPGYSGPEVEAKRQAINAWIRQSGQFDAVVDFDRALRDPDDPTVTRADLTADGLHPNTDGYRVMARHAARVVGRLLRRSAKR